MKKTLLEMVQSILTSMDSDTVNSIDDTDESMQVASFLRDSYYEIASGLDLPNTFGLFQLDASGDATKPTVMYLPAGWNSVQWVKYNKQGLLNQDAIQAEPPGFYSLANGNSSYNYDNSPSTIGGNSLLGPPYFDYVEYMDPEVFFERMFIVGSNDSADSIGGDAGSYQIQNSTGANFTIWYRADRPPKYYTSFDDRTYIFDSYDINVDSTLQSAKTFCWGEQTQVWLMENNFIPNLNDREFTLLENEAKQQAFVEAKQSSNPVATQRAHKGWVRAKRIKSNVGYNVNSRQKTTVAGFGRNPYPSPNAGTYHDHEPN